ncbi:heme utilization cystosolic carrier protein HutX [Agrobacterium vitis]|uniref:heme utilization cystosolic carrier protein HutX n=1 Tax=Agrobacterium vitis TaxID=373 RepID=UPI00203321D0|nr:heme utilization cystosolic carrier protein HutX [Agrobacterium vitis]MCM2449371.1 heme utilization cystosolic carrier protein HutX [Agrobacterium vitis]
MAAVDTARLSPLEVAKAALAEKPDGVVETIAAEAGVTPAEILAILPPDCVTIAPSEAFEPIWTHLSGWGDVLTIVHTKDVVLEVVGALPPGSIGHGWFNIHGDSPVGGHIRIDHCRSIAFGDRMFHGRRSLSVWFMNGEGAAMLKIFVRRDAQKTLIAEQVALFEQLRSQYRDVVSG